MFFNLAWRNAKRSRNENLIYFLTMVTAVAAFYIILSLDQQDVIRFLGELESDAVDKLLTTIMPMVYLCGLLFVFFLVVFANKYKLECRSRELGLYLMFGMKKQQLFFQLIMEGFITSLLALCVGIICGGFLSEIISLATARLVGQGVIAHQSSFSMGAVVWTAIGFLLIQAFALFILGGRILNQEVHQLLYGEITKKQNTGKASGNFLKLLGGIVSLAVAYWIVLNHFMTAGGVMLLVAVIFGIIGTLLFIQGLARLLSLLAVSAKNKATKGLYTFTLRQLQENIVSKYISISVASILMMLTIMLIADGSASIISYSDNLSRGSYIYDFTVMGDDKIVEQYLSSEKMKPYIAHLNPMETGNIKTPKTNGETSFVDLRKFREEVVHHLPPDVKDPAKQDAVSYTISSDNPTALNILGIIDTDGSTPYLIPVSTYNRLLEASDEVPLTLAANEAVFYINPDFFDYTQEVLNEISSTAKSKNESLLSIDGKPFFFVPSVPMKGLTADENIRITSALIVPDEVFKKYVNPDTCIVYWNFCIPEEMANSDGLMKSIMDANHLLKPSGFVYESYLNNFGRQLFYVIAESYTTLYMGFIFLIIACALLSLQFLTQMQASKKRYLTLSMLGANHEQMKRSINKQVLWYFLLPLLLACISGSVGLCAMQEYLHSSQTTIGQSYPLMLIMSGSVILVLVIYAIAVARTANREIGHLKWKINS